MASLVGNWLKCFEEVLAKQAVLAGLLDHPSTVGAAREFIVTKFLKSLLPAMLHIGTGIIVSHDSNGKEVRSKQIDIVIYDPRFPMLETQPGIGIYFVEGVVATIEVKSRLDSEKLKQSLENCASVLQMDGYVRSYDELNQLVLPLLAAGWSKTDAEEAVKWSLTPRTYIFAFNSDMSAEQASKIINGWYDDRKQSVSWARPYLPRVIAAGRFVGLLNSSQSVLGEADGFKIDPGSKVSSEAATKFGVQSRPVMGLWEIENRFAILASDLLQVAVGRMGLKDSRTEVNRPINAYLPFQDFSGEFIKGKIGYYVYWTGKTQ